MLSPVLFLLLLEWAVSVIWGPVYYPLPGVDEAAHYLHFTLPERFNPLFELRQDDDGPYMHTRPELYEGAGYFVKDQRFPAQRESGALRVAFLGGSSVQGWPWREDGVVFPELVGEKLRERFPGRRFDIINAGVGSYSSFQLVDVAWQLEAYRPDVAVIYAGHNDQGYYFFNRTFLEEARWGSLGGTSLERQLNRFHVYQQGRRLRDRLLGGGPAAGSADAVNSRPLPAHGRDEGASMDQPHVILPETAFVAEDEQALDSETFVESVRVQQEYLPQLFATNLRSVISSLQSVGTTVVLASPASNLRDYPPAFSMPFELLAPSDLDRLRELVSASYERLNQEGMHPRRLPEIGGNGEDMKAEAAWGPLPIPGAPARGSEPALSVCGDIQPLLDEAMSLSQTYADVHYIQGLCLLHTEPPAALQAFERARDLSPAMAPKQRAGSELIQTVQELGKDLGLPVVDVHAAFARSAELGIPDGYLFVDNLHFSQQGHRVAAKAITEVLEGLSVVRDGPSATRPSDPSPEDLVEDLVRRSKNPKWGMDIQVPGANEPYKDDTGVSDRPGHLVIQESP